MTEITINLRIKAGKNDKNRAVKAFVRVHPNRTADPNSIDFVPPDPPRRPDPGVNDREWMKRWLRKQLNTTINQGLQLLDREQNYTPPPVEDDIVEEEARA